MPKSAYLTCLWPGLARIWWAGDLRALFFSLIFSLFFNVAAYLTAFPKPEISPHVVIFGWVLLFSWWGAAIHASWSELPLLIGGSVQLAPASLLAEAHTVYLRRDYVAAEALISKILTDHPGDPAVRLLLASVYRQTGRFAEARGLLSSLQRDPAAWLWQFEIEADLARLDRLEKAASEEVSSSPDVESKPRVEIAPGEDASASTPARRPATRRAA